MLIFFILLLIWRIVLVLFAVLKLIHWLFGPICFALDSLIFFLFLFEGWKVLFIVFIFEPANVRILFIFARKISQ